MLGVVNEIDAPVFVDERPAKNRGMIAVPVDDALERHLLAFSGALRRIAAIRQLGPDQKAEAVGRIVIARIWRLDVTANSVEAELLGLEEAVLDKFERGERADGVGIIILIKRGPQVKGLAVQIKFSGARLDLAEAEICLLFVDKL